MVCLGCPRSVSWPPSFLPRCLLLGAAAGAFLCLRCLESAVSLSSFVSSLPVVGSVAPVVRPSVASSVPRGRVSAAVSVVAVHLAGDSVRVVCGDGRVRVCRVPYAVRALGRPLSVDAVFARLSARVGSSVRFVSAFGYSPDEWFVAVEAV